MSGSNTMPKANPIIIREASETDLDAIRAIYRDEAQATRQQNKQATALGAQYPQADRDFINRQQSGEKRYQVMVAELNGEVVGYARALHRLDTKAPLEATDAGSRQTTLHKLGVLEEHQNKGIGRLLTESVKERAGELSRTTVRVVLPEGNPLSFYEKMGFLKVGELPAPSENMRPLTIMDAAIPRKWNLPDVTKRSHLERER